MPFLCPSVVYRPGRVDPALEGTWSSGSDQKAELGFQKSGDHKYDLAILCKGDKSECPNTEVRQNYEVNLVRRGGGTERTYDSRRQQGVSVFREEMRSLSVGDRFQFTAPLHRPTTSELRTASWGTSKASTNSGAYA